MKHKESYDEVIIEHDETILQRETFILMEMGDKEASRSGWGLSRNLVGTQRYKYVDIVISWCVRAAKTSDHPLLFKKIIGI